MRGWQGQRIECKKWLKKTPKIWKLFFQSNTDIKLNIMTMKRCTDFCNHSIRKIFKQKCIFDSKGKLHLFALHSTRPCLFFVLYCNAMHSAVLLLLCITLQLSTKCCCCCCCCYALLIFRSDHTHSQVEPTLFSI